MGTLTHKAARAAYGTAIDAVLKHVKKDREKGLLELVDLTEKYMGDNFQKENYEAARKMIQDPDNKWVKYVNHMIDELDPSEEFNVVVIQECTPILYDEDGNAYADWDNVVTDSSNTQE